MVEVAENSEGDNQASLWVFEILKERVIFII